MRGTISTEYGNVEIREKITKYLMRNLDIGQDIMWRTRDGKYVVEYRRTFAGHMVEHMHRIW